ncbi:MAG: Slp family lipoprotein [Nitrosospira sp.]|nr:Slp family lipoprotein [Nitrosospira sp.]
MKRYLLLSCLLLMGACSGLPERVRNVPVSDVSYVQARQNLSSYKGTSVRWGGVIVDVENEENFTLVEVLSYPQSSYGRPQLRKESGGRFVIQSSEFLDPAVYAKDKEITVAGTIEGDVERVIGKKRIRMPLVSSKALYLWPAYQSYPYYGGYGGYGGYGHFGGFNPYFGYGYYGYPFRWGGYGPWGGYYGPFW